jgi:hypothetical protein
VGLAGATIVGLYERLMLAQQIDTPAARLGHYVWLAQPRRAQEHMAIGQRQ